MSIAAYDFPELLGPTKIVKGFICIVPFFIGPKFFKSTFKSIFYRSLDLPSINISETHIYRRSSSLKKHFDFCQVNLCKYNTYKIIPTYCKNTLQTYCISRSSDLHQSLQSIKEYIPEQEACSGRYGCKEEVLRLQKRVADCARDSQSACNCDDQRDWLE